MDREWWIPVVQWTVWGLVMTAVMGWVAKGRLRERAESDLRTLVHPVSTLVIGAFGALFFFAIAIISNTVGKNATTTVLATLVFVGFGLGSLLMVAEYFRARHRVSEEGLEYGRLFGSRGSLRWSDVRRVRYSPSAKWFILETQSGGKVRLSVMLMGLPEFARLLLAHVPPEAIDADTRAILRETQEGNPPSVWR